MSGAHLTGGNTRFCRMSTKFRNYALFVGQIIKYGLRIILGFGSNGLWDVNQINFIYALLSRIQLCRYYALFEGHFWPKFGDGGALKHFYDDDDYVNISLKAFFRCQWIA